MQGLIIVATLITLVASFIVINTRTSKSQPIIAQPKRRQLRRPKDRQKRYYQRRIRVIQEQRQHEHNQWLKMLAAVMYHQYRAGQVVVARN